MSLDYEFAPIDVSIMTHPKACKAGPEAMGLWLFGQCFAKLHKTGGVVHRPTVLGAWNGRRNIMLAKRLVEAGLWTEREDGDWDIHNFEKKGPGQQSASAARMRKLRAVRKEQPAESVTAVTDVTPCDANGVTPCSTSHSTSTSSGSDLQGDARGGTPDWVDPTLESVALATGETFDRGIVWTKYQAARERDGRTPSAPDFRSFLASWASTQKTNRVRDRGRKQADTRQPLRDVEGATWLKPTGTSDL